MGLSYTHGASIVPLIGQTIADNLTETARRLPDADALVVRHQGIRRTYRELVADVEQVARGLLSYGLAKGDRVGIWSPNNAEWVLAQYATAAIGVILVNINPAYRTHEVEYVLRQSGCRMLLSATEHKTSDYAAMVAEVRAQLPQLETVVFLGTPDWDELLARAAAVPVEAVAARAAELSFDDPINIQYTSGTTGFPKGATLSHHNILNNGFFVGEGCGFTDQDRVCVPVPFYHCFGMVMGNLGSTTHGATIVVPAPAF